MGLGRYLLIGYILVPNPAAGITALEIALIVLLLDMIKYSFRNEKNL